MIHEFGMPGLGKIRQSIKSTAATDWAESTDRPAVPQELQVLFEMPSLALPQCDTCFRKVDKALSWWRL